MLQISSLPKKIKGVHNNNLSNFPIRAWGGGGDILRSCQCPSRHDQSSMLTTTITAIAFIPVADLLIFHAKGLDLY